MKILIFIFLFIPSSLTVLVGVDLSHTEWFESGGVIYRDEEGQPKDLFQMIKDNGIDLIRVRLFTSNEEQAHQDPYNYGNTLNRTLKLARRLSRQRLQFILDFHYSDTWADPEHQTKPMKWNYLSFEQLLNTLFSYTRDSLQLFVDQNTIPRYIQIGNEITNGMLWPDGKLEGDGNWTRLAALLKSASRAVRLVLGEKSKILIHITSSTDWSHAKWFFDQVTADVDFDIISLSYYPVWHGTLTQLHFCLQQLSLHYDKPIFIVETNYRWKKDQYLKESLINITGFEETPEGQVQYVKYIAQMLNNLSRANREPGLLWWAAEYVNSANQTNLGGFGLKSFFDANGVALPILKTFGQLIEHSKQRQRFLWIIYSILIIIGSLLVYRKWGNPWDLSQKIRKFSRFL